MRIKRVFIIIVIMILPLISMADIRFNPQYWCQNANPNGRNEWIKTYGSVDLTIKSDESYIEMRMNNKVNYFTIISIDEVMKDLWAIKALNEQNKRVLFQLSFGINNTELYLITENGAIGFKEIWSH